MAEYYPLLAKAIGSLPNSTADTRRVVYERARKALIGQLRTLHPPVPDEDIEKESVELDRAVERLEAELANGVAVSPIAPAAPAPSPGPTRAPSLAPTTPPAPPAASGPDKTADRSQPPAAPRPPPPALRPRPPLPDRKPITPRPPLAKPPAPNPAARAADGAAAPPAPTGAADADLTPLAENTPAETPVVDAKPVDAKPVDAKPVDAKPVDADGTDEGRRLKPPQRPIAPQPPAAAAPRRRLWIIPLVVALVVAVVAAAAWKLRDRPETLARKPADQTQKDSGKIAERVGAPAQPSKGNESEAPAKPTPSAGTQPSTNAQPAQQTQASAPANPELQVARRAALLVEAPDEASKVKTFVGNVVWKLNNAPQGANAAVGLAVEADVDLPDDKMRAVIVFEKNSDASLPASHTIKIRFMVEPGSFTGNIKQISVPQMRPEASPNGEPLAGVTVQIVPNSFLVGLSPGNAEAANTDLMRRLQWVDIPMLLDNGKIAKLTFEKGDSGRRDLDEAFEAWQK